MRHMVEFDLTIPQGSTDSNVYVLPRTLETLVDITIFGPSVLTGVVTLQLGYKQSTLMADCSPATIAGTAVTIGAASANPLPIGAFRAIALKSAASEGSARTFRVVAQVDLAC